MAFIDQIISVSDRKFDDVKKLQQTKDPIVMYGAGSYARDVTQFLASHDIHIDEYCIDGSYLVKQPVSMSGLTVQPIEDAFKKYKRFNIVIGFNDYVKARQNLERLGGEAALYFIDAPNQYGFFDKQYVADHLEAFNQTYDWLEDEKSRDIFIAFINAKISGDPAGLYQFAEFNQYFGDPVHLTEQETFVDCGAFDGDTVDSFVKNVHGKYRKIYSFEPDIENFKKLQERIQTEGLEDVVAVQKGCWSSTGELRFSSGANMAAIVDAATKADFVVPVTTIDETVGDDPVTFIKMDIEGAEYEALRGAERAILAYLPTLAICAYHKPEDLITLPQYIKQLHDGYRLYLRHHQYMSWEMVLYAMPERG